MPGIITAAVASAVADNQWKVRIDKTLFYFPERGAAGKLVLAPGRNRAVHRNGNFGALVTKLSHNGAIWCRRRSLCRCNQGISQDRVVQATASQLTGVSLRY
jgi:hypothetical protein